MTTLLNRIIGFTLGIALSFYAKQNEVARIKFAWLAHFLIGTGKAKVIPSWLARDWNRAMVRREGNRFLIRPYPSELFWLVGSMHVTIENGRVYGIDKYDFAPQLGQNTVFGDDKSLQWAWSGGESDPTRIKESQLLTHVMRVLGWYGKYVKVTDDKHYLISNELWNVLGGKMFDSILDYRLEESQYQY